MIEQARQIALDAGRLLTAKLESGITIEHKGSIDLVTDADRAAEEYIVGQIQSMFPNHGILGSFAATFAVQALKCLVERHYKTYFFAF